MYVQVNGAATVGISGWPVQVEVDMGAGLPGMDIVGDYYRFFLEC